MARSSDSGSSTCKTQNELAREEATSDLRLMVRSTEVELFPEPVDFGVRVNCC